MFLAFFSGEYKYADDADNIFGVFFTRPPSDSLDSKNIPHVEDFLVIHL